MLFDFVCLVVCIEFEFKWFILQCDYNECVECECVVVCVDVLIINFERSYYVVFFDVFVFEVVLEDEWMVCECIFEVFCDVYVDGNVECDVFMSEFGEYLVLKFGIKVL